MPLANINNLRLYYRLEGNPERPVLVFSHSIGCDHGMWAEQAQALLPYFRILRFDTRGHGASDVPAGEYSVEQLATDALALLDSLSIGKFAWCGLSMGGAIGQWIAIHAPERLTQLVLANTTSQFVPRSNWETRIRAVQEGGIASILDLATKRFFSAETIARKDPAVESIREVLLKTNPAGYLGCCAALRDFNSTSQLREVRVPTLIIVGERDVSTPWSGHGEILAREIAGARALHLPAAHLSNLEQSRTFTCALLEFLQPPLSAADTLDAGFAVRRSVLGDGHVDRSIAGTNEFNREFQALITRYAWGTIWTRPLLDQRTRRLLVLAMTAAMGRWEEFRLHIHSGLEHELELCDLKEVLLQTAVYAGVPAANTAFHVVNEELEKSRPAHP
jgi:3-oxoadipate enol-lactonase/4-carboxymuconolactone decarboxylase